MIEVKKYQGRRVLVIGAGKTGISTVHALIAGGAKVYLYDDNQVNLHNNIKNETLDSILLRRAIGIGSLELVPSLKVAPWKELAAMIVSPGVPTQGSKKHECFTLAHGYHITVLSDLDLLYITCPNSRYLGITGTNGKSTTTALIAHILQKCGLIATAGGNIGEAALSLDPCDRYGHYVLELSSFQLELISEIKFNIAVLLNITEDHMDRYEKMEDYINAKLNIFNQQSIEDCAIIGIDNNITRNIYETIASDHKQTLIATSTTSVPALGIGIVDGILYDCISSNKKEIQLPEMPHLRGPHNMENIAAAYAAARVLGLPAEDIIRAVQSFIGLAHRMEFFHEKDGIKFINDSKGTNVESTKMALSSFDNIYWIAGGINKGGSLEEVAHLFPRIAKTYLVGKAQEDFATVLLKHKVEHVRSETIENALKQIKQDLKNKNEAAVVLLSPACSSYDQWRSYTHRGDTFKQLVKELF
jgi:UDP-N-acetylmuramoylalanine--D-glutamate ligase